jgi:hypothetical protein
MEEVREWLKTGNRMRIALVAIIAATIPCYCLGSLALWNASREQTDSTPTATMDLSGTTLPITSPTLTLLFQPPTATQTGTATQTFTPTITYVLPPTKTPTPSPSPQPSLTPEPTSTSTSTPEPTATDVPAASNTPTTMGAP